MTNNTLIEATYRLEPGCLGPDGAQYITEFCQFAQPLVSAHAPAFMQWVLTPRFDKTLPELQFSLAGRVLSDSQAERLCSSYQTDADTLVEELNHHLMLLIDQYFGRW